MHVFEYLLPVITKIEFRVYYSYRIGYRNVIINLGRMRDAEFGGGYSEKPILSILRKLIIHEREK